ncbi:thiol reductant ABC exporter subunit CydC [Lysinibacillus sp. 54212]|uniref:thiol reductant ABC exporter subunit CydC n=1 Tax=Lysinibacillus sp. 54212 TaxID=3119829 RepID=UPI002FC7E1CB
MKALYSMIWQDKKDVLLAMAAGTISGLTAVALFAQSGFLISKAALMPPFYIILILTAFLKLFGVVKSASKYGERYISHRVTFRFMSAVRMRFFKKLVGQANLLHTYKSGDLLNRITSDVDVLQNFFLRVVYPPFIALFVFLATILFTVWFSPWISLILMIGFIFTSTIVPAFLISQKRNMDRSSVKRVFSNDATEYLYGYRDLQLHNQLASKEQALQKISLDYSRQIRQEMNREQSAHFWNQLISLLTAFFIVGVGAYLVSIGDLDGLYFAMLILISLTVFESAIGLAVVPSHYLNAEEATNRLEEVCSTPAINSKPLVRDKRLKITCDKVSYSYEQSIHPAISQVSFAVSPGKKVAIVGQSGSGKSTIFQLLIQELQPSSGNILVNEQSIVEIEKQQLWDQMSIQLQHNHFFSGTLRDNLLLAKPAAPDEELQHVLNQVFISKPLDSPIYEKGSNLSGGEKQRLAFARVLLKNTELWLLDEPFTSVDAKTEAHLFDTLLNCGRDKTIILITHKLTDLARMDNILLMDNGELTESGTFEQLMSARGLFYKMYQGQKR